jgi:pimeloyl-ACP methyl ester carboxylesterase
MAYVMRDRIRDSRLHVLPESGHSLLIEAPEQVTSLLEAFL